MSAEKRKYDEIAVDCEDAGKCVKLDDFADDVDGNRSFDLGENFECVGDWNNAIPHYRLARTKGHIEATWRLVRCLENRIDSDEYSDYDNSADEDSDDESNDERNTDIDDRNTEIHDLLVELANKNHVKAINRLANDKYKDKEYDEMIQLYEKAITLGHADSMCELANHYAKIKDVENAKKYYKMGANHNCVESICKFIEIMEKIDMTETMVLCGMGIALESSFCANKIATFHAKNNNHILAGEYFLKSYEMPCFTRGSFKHHYRNAEYKWSGCASYAMCCHFKLKKYDDARKHYELSLKHYEPALTCAEKNKNNNFYVHMVISYAQFCRSIDNNKSKSIELYAKGYAKMHANSFANYSKNNLPTEQMQIYHELTKSHPTGKIITEFRKLPQVSKFINKMAYTTRTNYIDMCLLCHETKLQISHDCFHTTCVDCYVEHGVCPYNACNKTNTANPQQP